METRIDQWLWAVRLFKTRSIASEACKKGRILINGVVAKPSKSIKSGDIIQIKRTPVTYSFKVLQPIRKRIGPKIVPQMVENITPQEEYDKLNISKYGAFMIRDSGLGRPTKKERRDMINFIDENITDYFDLDE